MKLIDKEKVIVEIKRRISLFKKEKKTEKWSAGASQMNVVSLGARIAMLEEILSFLNTLEVKEVDCDKEIGMYTTKELLWKRNKATNVFHLTQGDIDRIAKHFFELGLKTKKRE